LEPSIVIPLVTLAAMYYIGCRRRSAPISGWTIVSFILGWITLAIALLSPLHHLGEELFFAHMAQHEVLMLVCAPLLVFARLDLILPWSLPIAARRQLHVPTAHNASLALIVHAIAIWGWHIPVLYQASIQSEAVHALQHISFIGTAFWFWWTLFHSMAARRQYGLAAAYVFITALHTSILGAILTFSSRIWYPLYAETAPHYGLSVLQDQQLGGLLMWIPANLVYVAIGLWLLRSWIIESERRIPLTQLASLMAQESRHA
jgi:putative membrane protein